MYARDNASGELLRWQRPVRGRGDVERREHVAHTEEQGRFGKMQAWAQRDER